MNWQSLTEEEINELQDDYVFFEHPTKIVAIIDNILRKKNSKNKSITPIAQNQMDTELEIHIAVPPNTQLYAIPLLKNKK